MLGKFERWPRRKLKNRNSNKLSKRIWNIKMAIETIVDQIFTLTVVLAIRHPITVVQVI